MRETIEVQDHIYANYLAWSGAVFAGEDPATLEQVLRTVQAHAAKRGFECPAGFWCSSAETCAHWDYEA